MLVSDWSGTSLSWFEEFTALKDRIGSLFRRAEPRRQVGLLLEGFIGGAEHKNGWHWRNMQVIARHGGCRRFSAGRYGIKKKLGTFAGIM